MDKKIKAGERFKKIAEAVDEDAIEKPKKKYLKQNKKIVKEFESDEESCDDYSEENCKPVSKKNNSNKKLLVRRLKKETKFW